MLSLHETFHGFPLLRINRTLAMACIPAELAWCQHSLLAMLAVFHVWIPPLSLHLPMYVIIPYFLFQNFLKHHFLQGSHPSLLYRLNSFFLPLPFVNIKRSFSNTGFQAVWEQRPFPLYSSVPGIEQEPSSSYVLSEIF